LNVTFKLSQKNWIVLFENFVLSLKALNLKTLMNYLKTLKKRVEQFTQFEKPLMNYV